MGVGIIYDIESKVAGKWNSIFGDSIEGYVNRNEAKAKLDELRGKGETVRMIEVTRRVIHLQ